MTTLDADSPAAAPGPVPSPWDADTLAKLPRGIAPPPTHRSYDEARRHRKQMLAAALRVFAQQGYDEGIAGHITVRDPEDPRCFWVNPFGIPFALIRASDLILVADDGTVVEGDYDVNRAAFAIHSQIHQARPDVIAAAHSHSPAGKAFSTLGRLLDPITQDACQFFEDHAVFDHYSGVVLDLDEGRQIADTLGDRKALILQNHGLLTVGRSVEEALYWFVAMERCALAQLRAEAVGTPIHIAPEAAYRAGGGRARADNAIRGWFSGQAMFQVVIRQQPDLLE